MLTRTVCLILLLLQSYSETDSGACDADENANGDTNFMDPDVILKTITTEMKVKEQMKLYREAMTGEVLQMQHMVTDIRGSEKPDAAVEFLRTEARDNISPGLDLPRLLRAYRVLCQLNPEVPSFWADLSIHLTYHVDYLIATYGIFDYQYNILLEALAAFTTAEYLTESIADNDRMIKMKSLVLHKLSKHYPHRCIQLFPTNKNCNLYQQQQNMMKLMYEGGGVLPDNHIEAVNTFCTNLRSVTSALSEYERESGFMSAFFARSVLVKLRVCGVVRVRKVWTPEFMSSIIDAQREVLEGFMDTNPQINKDNHDDFKQFEQSEAASRSNGRFEHKLPLQAPFTNPGFVNNDILLFCVKLVLCKQVELDMFSFVTSLPNAPMQHWHSDVSGVFGGRGARIFHTAPTGLVAIIPFDDVNKVTGPTEFQFGSHVNLGVNFWTKRDEEPVTQRVKVKCSVGDFALFDVRVRHRGTPNSSPNPRSIGYISFAKAWWTDHVNFKEKQRRNWDSLSKNRQKLLGYLDSLTYTKDLEALLEKHEGSGSLEGMRAKSSIETKDVY